MRIAKVDANQKAITEALRKIGATVTPTHMVSDGFPDLAVGYRGRSILLEIKDGKKPPSARKLTPDEEKWHANWRGEAYIVSSIEEAIKVVSNGEIEKTA